MLHAKAAVVKLAASEAGGRVVDRALQMFGGRGYMRENPCERLYRDLRVDRIWEGTSEIQRLIVGNEVAKRGLDGVLVVRDGRGGGRSGRLTRRRPPRRTVRCRRRSRRSSASSCRTGSPTSPATKPLTFELYASMMFEKYGMM